MPTLDDYSIDSNGRIAGWIRNHPTIADGDGSRQPSKTELDGARYLGKRVATTAAKLHG